VREGDYIISIEDEDVKWSKHGEVVEKIKLHSNSVKLKLMHVRSIIRYNQQQKPNYNNNKKPRAPIAPTTSISQPSISKLTQFKSNNDLLPPKYIKKDNDSPLSFKQQIEFQLEQQNNLNKITTSSYHNNSKVFRLKSPFFRQKRSATPTKVPWWSESTTMGTNSLLLSTPPSISHKNIGIAATGTDPSSFKFHKMNSSQPSTPRLERIFDNLTNKFLKNNNSEEPTANHHLQQQHKRFKYKSANNIHFTSEDDEIIRFNNNHRDGEGNNNKDKDHLFWHSVGKSFKSPFTNTLTIGRKFKRSLLKMSLFTNPSTENLNHIHNNHQTFDKEHDLLSIKTVQTPILNKKTNDDEIELKELELEATNALFINDNDGKSLNLLVRRNLNLNKNSRKDKRKLLIERCNKLAELKDPTFEEKEAIYRTI
jgi:hypothetical protein